MKNTVNKTITILISAAFFAGFTSCGVGTGSSMETNTPGQTLEETNAESKDNEEEITVKITEDTTAAIYAANVDNDAVEAFQEAKLIKVGEHTYYTDYLFRSDRDKMFKDYILSVLEECDKDLHDNIFVYVIMEAETKDEFRFSAKIIMNDVILEEGEMMNWYTPETGYVWDYDYSQFRRCDFTMSDIVPSEEACTTVYEDAKANSQKHRKFHALRHTSATLLLYGGVNIKQVQGRLGHSDIKVTNQYLHCIAEADEAAANVLQDMLITKKENSEQAEPINKIQKIG